MPQKRVAVAMSGGVDSSVAAAILKDEHYQVIGITMLLNPFKEDSTLENAIKIAESIGIPHQTVDFRKTFKRRIIAPFCNEYQRGRTPNPCINCNNQIKFGALLKKAKKMGADFLATGHYARIKNSKYGYNLLKGVDHSKDQSYFLYLLQQKQFQYLLMPMGYLHKSQAKRIAKQLGFTDFIKSESQDICFIPNSDYSTFINENAPTSPGEIIDIEGRVLGKHSGLARYTIGQRQGLGLASDKRLYVIRIDIDNNRLVVGNQEHLLANSLRIYQLSWISGEAPIKTDGITAKIRYRSPEIKVSLRIQNGVTEVRFSQPQQSVAPGQSIVFYQGDVVLGGGIIEKPD